jgi:hypothetical protein
VTTFPRSPRLLKGGLVLLNPTTSTVVRVIVLQYNPDTLTRTLQVQAVDTQGGADRSQALRIKAPPVETFKLDAEIDATDQLEHPTENATAVDVGIQPQLAALETIVYPASADLLANDRLASGGALEIIPMEAPLTLFVWNRSRIIPVRLTEFSITEEAFDPALNPIRAKVSLGMRALTVNDFGFDHKGGALYLLYHQQKERLAGLGPAATLGALGLRGIP